MGKVDRLHNEVEPFAVLFSALGIVLGHVQVTQPAGLAWYCTVRQDSVSFNLIEDASAPFLFPSTVLFMYLCIYVQYCTVYPGKSAWTHSPVHTTVHCTHSC